MSNTRKQNIYAQKMQDEATRMEEKLNKLKSNLNIEKSERTSMTSSQHSRWDKNGSVLRETKNQPTCGAIEQFLQSIKMENYAQKFKENGFDELDILLDIQNEQLNQMQIPMGHQIRLMMKIKQFKDKPTSIQQPQQNQYEELEAPEVDLSFSQQTTGGTQTQTQTQRPAIKSSKQSQRIKSAKKVSFIVQQDESQDQVDRSFLMNQLQEISAYMNYKDQNQEYWNRRHEESADMDLEDRLDKILGEQDSQLAFTTNSQQSVLWTKKVACWSCYKLIENNDQMHYITKDSRQFCNNDCLLKYSQLFEIECQECKQLCQFDKMILLNALQFCSEECSRHYDFQLMKDTVEQMGVYFKTGDGVDEQQESNQQESDQYEYDLEWDDINLMG